MARFGTRDGETSGSATVLGYYPQEAAFCDISDLHSRFVAPLRLIVLITKAVRTSEKLINFYNTKQHISEDSHL